MQLKSASDEDGSTGALLPGGGGSTPSSRASPQAPARARLSPGLTDAAWQNSGSRSEYARTLKFSEQLSITNTNTDNNTDISVDINNEKARHSFITPPSTTAPTTTSPPPSPPTNNLAERGGLQSERSGGMAWSPPSTMRSYLARPTRLLSLLLYLFFLFFSFLCVMVDGVTTTYSIGPNIYQIPSNTQYLDIVATG